jgi:hypothetical protein
VPGVRRERIVERLARIQSPRRRFQEQREIERGERVLSDRSDVANVLHGLGKRIPPGNYEGGRPWAWAEAHVDLKALVDEAPSTSR